VITIEPATRASVEFYRAWPEAFQAILNADAPCPTGVDMLLTVADDALTGADAHQFGAAERVMRLLTSPAAGQR